MLFLYLMKLKIRKIKKGCEICRIEIEKDQWEMDQEQMVEEVVVDVEQLEEQIDNYGKRCKV